MLFSLVIPCYNESESSPMLVRRCEDMLNTSNLNIEVILVDNGSIDNTYEILKKNINNQNIKILKLNRNLGYGGGILEGLKFSSGDYIGWTHADSQTDPKDFEKGLNLIYEDNTSEVFIKGQRTGRSFIDYFFTFGMSIFETIFLRKLLFDINAQPTIFSRKFFLSWENPPKDFSLDLYAYFLAKKENFLIRRFSVNFSKRLYGSSSWNTGLKSRLKFIKRTIIYSLSLKKSIND